MPDVFAMGVVNPVGLGLGRVYVHQMLQGGVEHLYQMLQGGVECTYTRCYKVGQSTYTRCYKAEVVCI